MQRVWLVEAAGRAAAAAAGGLGRRGARGRRGALLARVGSSSSKNDMSGLLLAGAPGASMTACRHGAILQLRRQRPISCPSGRQSARRAANAGAWCRPPTSRLRRPTRGARAHATRWCSAATGCVARARRRRLRRRLARARRAAATARSRSSGSRCATSRTPSARRARRSRPPGWQHPAIVALLRGRAATRTPSTWSPSSSTASTLAQLIAEGALSDRECCGSASRSVHALAHAHARGVVHRDVKPQNVHRPRRPAPRRTSADRQADRLRRRRCSAARTR